MASPQPKLKQRFDSALKAYLNAIGAHKRALVVVLDKLTKETDVAYERAAEEEKDARRKYRKATKKLRESFLKK